MKRAAPGRAPAHVRGVLALLVAVVGLLCVFTHAESGARGMPAPTAERVQTSAAAAAAAAVAEPSDGAAAPCGKKAIGDSSVQRAENPPPSAAFPRATSPHTDPAPLVPQHFGVFAGGPDPPSPTLHSVLRM
ncbi:hypothetical protein ACH4D3_01230 [Streptomyces sp. NPDC018026]|uniref:hypothetical protein n=1 Tax=Streptomyces sp. NPDC018026 TaxID=3365031 RepID=UPI003788A0B1